jgi:hypothetical protein
MGEYAIYRGQRIKIGTCEDLTDLRADQWHLVAVAPAGDDKRNYLRHSRFRFPWPDEDAIEPGGFTEIERSCLIRGATAPPEMKDDHSTVQFKAAGGYLCSLPCPESGVELDGAKIHRNGFQGAVHLCAQRWWNGLLVGVLTCSSCGCKWRLETLADAEPIAVALRSEADRQRAERAAWFHTVADRLLAGYSQPSADAARSGGTQ